MLVELELAGKVVINFYFKFYHFFCCILILTNYKYNIVIVSHTIIMILFFSLLFVCKLLMFHCLAVDTRHLSIIYSPCLEEIIKRMLQFIIQFLANHKLIKKKPIKLPRKLQLLAMGVHYLHR